MRLSKFFFLTTSFFLVFFLKFSVSEIFAQSCSGSPSCYEYVTTRRCSNSGDSCSGSGPDGGCELGEGSCVTESDYANPSGGRCIALSTYCDVSCNNGGIVQGGGCTFVRPPPPVQQVPPPQTNPYTPPQNTGTPPDDEPDPSPVPRYACTPGFGCFADAWGAYTDMSACMASCSWSGSFDNDVTDPDAGESSCDDVREIASDAIIWPGATREWQTWATTPGSDRFVRLETESPGLTTASFTSPGDMLTIAHALQGTETFIYAYYAYNDETKMYYFFQGNGKWPVIFIDPTRVDGPAQIELVKSLGYTWGLDMSAEKRAHPYVESDGTRWNATAQHRVPRGADLMPLTNCASTLMADDHNYIQLFGSCGRRYNDGGIMRGNYLGMEKDIRQYSDCHDEPWNHTGVCVTERRDGTVKRQIDVDVTMENAFWFRQPVLQLPVQTFDTEENDIRIYFATHPDASGLTPFKPSSSANDDCMLKEIRWNLTDDWETEIPPRCDSIQIKKSGSNDFVSELEAGETYEFITRASGESFYYGFYNQDFENDNTFSQYDGWAKSNSVTEMELVPCANTASSPCPTEGQTSTILRAKWNSSNPLIFTNYFEAKRNLNGRKLKVEFDVRSDTTNNVPLKMSVKRYNNIRFETMPPYYEENLNDTQPVEFEFFDRANNTEAFVDNDWQRLTGYVTFPDTGSSSTKIRLILDLPDAYYDGSLFFDNFHVSSVDAPNAVGTGLTTENNCSTDVFVTEANPTGEAGVYTTTQTIPAGTPTGEYHIYSNIDLSGTPGDDRAYVGRPGWRPGGPCTPDPDYTYTGTCNYKIDVKQCYNVDPSTPRFIFPTGIVSGNELRLGGSYNSENVEIHAEARGDVAATTKMELIVTKKGDSSVTATIQGVPLGPPGQYKFNLTTANVLNATFGNEVILSLRAVNENDCDATGDTSYSAPQTKEVLMTKGRFGQVIEVDPNNEACEATYNDANGAGLPDWVSVANDVSVSVTAVNNNQYLNTTVTPINSITYSVFLPFNPFNQTNWGRYLSSINVSFRNDEDSDGKTLACVSCNPQVGGSLNPLTCQITNFTERFKASNNYGNNLNVYVIRALTQFDSWWQTRGGLVHAEGNLSSKVPVYNGSENVLCAASPDCIAAITARMFPVPSSNQEETAGIITADGTIAKIAKSQNIAGYITESVNTSNQQQFVDGSQLKPVKESFTYFTNLVDEYDSLTTISSSSNVGAAILTLGNYATEPDSGANVRMAKIESDATINLQSDFNIPNDLKYVIFVEGTLTITGSGSDNTQTVAPGGNLMIIAQDDIIFDEDFGYSDPNETVPLVEGIFIAGRDLIVRSDGNNNTSDRKFIGAGSFIGLQGVDLQREFRSDQVIDLEKNAYSPTEQFIFRPDLVVNVPEMFKQPGVQWEETN